MNNNEGKRSYIAPMASVLEADNDPSKGSDYVDGEVWVNNVNLENID